MLARANKYLSVITGNVLQVCLIVELSLKANFNQHVKFLPVSLFLISVNLSTL